LQTVPFARCRLPAVPGFLSRRGHQIDFWLSGVFSERRGFHIATPRRRRFSGNQSAGAVLHKARPSAFTPKRIEASATDVMCCAELIDECMQRRQGIAQ